MMLDEALDFRGNFYFGAVSGCCVGCAAWQRVFNLLPRWALTTACLSLVGTYTPWAFGQSLANLHSWGGGGRRSPCCGICRTRCRLMFLTADVFCEVHPFSSHQDSLNT